MPIGGINVVDNHEHSDHCHHNVVTTFKLNILVDSCMCADQWMVNASVLWQIGRLLSVRHHTGHTYCCHTGDTLLLWQQASPVYKSKSSTMVDSGGWWTVKWCEAYWGITSGRNAPSAPQQLQHFCSIVHNHTFELLRLIHTHSLIQSRPQYEWHGPSIMSGLHLTYSPFCHPHTVNHYVSLGLDSPYWGKCIGNRQLNSSAPCYPQNDPFCDMSIVTCNRALWNKAIQN